MTTMGDANQSPWGGLSSRPLPSTPTPVFMPPQRILGGLIPLHYPVATHQWTYS